jgi:hypothetical protein
MLSLRSKHFYQKLLFVVVLCITLSAHSASSYSEDSLRKIYLEIRYLYQLGVDIHQRYDFNDREQIGKCKFEVGHNATRAKGLIGSVNRIDYPEKEQLIEAAWAAYSCSSCGGDGKVCDSIPEQLDIIKQVIKQGQSE